jgi:predicted alpha/beta-hydrolase family hydrolase
MTGEDNPLVSEPDEVRIDVGDRRTSGLWTRAGGEPTAVAVIAPGAGNAMTHAYFEGIVQAMSAAGVSCLRFNFLYADAGRRYPDPPPVLMATWRAALDAAAARADGLPLIASGKSMGGRIASMVAAEDAEAFTARALVFFGYPLHAPGKEDQPRDEHLSRVGVPMLFIEGTRDPFARFELVSSVVSRLAPLARMHVIEGGDHSHRVRGVRQSDREIGASLGEVAAAFAREVL